MTNTDLVKRLLDEDVLPYLSPEQVIDLCSEAAAAIIGLGSANKALTARLATIEAATIERCAELVDYQFVGVFCQGGHFQGRKAKDDLSAAIRALAPLDTEAMVERVAKAIMECDAAGNIHWTAAKVVARAALAAMGVGR